VSAEQQLGFATNVYFWKLNPLPPSGFPWLQLPFLIFQAKHMPHVLEWLIEAQRLPNILFACLLCFY